MFMPLVLCKTDGDSRGSHGVRTTTLAGSKYRDEDSVEREREREGGEIGRERERERYVPAGGTTYPLHNSLPPH